MQLIVAATLFLALAAPPQEPSAYAQAKVLEKVRATGFLPHQVAALRDAAVLVDGFNADYHKQEAALKVEEAGLVPLLDALAKGTPLTPAQRDRLKQSTDRRSAMVEQWETRVQGAVTRVLGTLSDDQRYQLGVPENVRQKVDSAWNQLQNATGDDIAKVHRDLASRLMRNEYNRVRSANSGSTDRGRQQDRRQQSADQRAMWTELRRQGEQFLVQVRSGNRNAVRGFYEQMAQSYMRDGDVDRNLRELVKAIITAEGATPALKAAAG